MSERPRQPTYTDEHGVERFAENEIVRWLLDNGRLDMNDIDRQRHFSDEDRRQFAQLIGYSVSGYYGLSYAENEDNSKPAAAVEQFRAALKEAGVYVDHATVWVPGGSLTTAIEALLAAGWAPPET